MGRSRAWTIVALILVVLLISTLAFIFFADVLRSGPTGYKAPCIANIKQIALACIMYAADYDEVLPDRVPHDSDGTAHAVGGVYKDWKFAPFQRDVRAKHGEEYADGRWMWQLGDALLTQPPGSPYADIGYLSSPDVLDCAALVRTEQRFRLRKYLVGTDKNTGAPDPDDPLLAHLRAGSHKVWQSGSYVYMCAHHPYGNGVRTSDYGADFMTLWDVANLLGYIGKPGVLDAADPQDYLACGNAVGTFTDPIWEPLVMCRSYGVHEEYSRAYAQAHVIPPELAPAFGLTREEVTPTIQVTTPMAFVDGHAKYVRMSFYRMLALIVSPNKTP